MATLSETVQIVFKGVDDTKGALDSVASGLQSIQGSVGSVTGPLATVSESILKIEAAAIAAGAALITYAASTANDFEIQFSEIASLIDEPKDALGEFRDSILSFAAGSTASLSDVNQAIYGAISAGVDYKDSLEFVKQAQTLAVAGNAELGSSTQLLASVVNAYGKENLSANQAADILFTTVKQGQVTIPELSQSLANVTLVAANSGVSFSEVNAAIAALTASGLPASQAITGLKATISNIIKPSAQAAELAAQLGLEFNAEALQAKGLEGVLDDVAEATGGNTSQMTLLFGSVEALGVAQALTGKASEKFTKVLQANADSAGAASEAQEKFTDTLLRITNTIDVFLIRLGDPFRDSFVGASQAISAIGDALGLALNDKDKLKPFIDVLVGFANQIENTLTAIAQNLPDALEGLKLDPLIRGVNNVKDALADLFRAVAGGNVDLTSVEGLRKAIQGIIDITGRFQDVVASIIRTLTPYIEKLAELGKNALETIKGKEELIGQILGTAQAVNSLLPFVGQLASGFETLAGGIGLFFGAKGLVALAGNIKTLGVSVAYLAGPLALGLLTYQLTRLSGLGDTLNDILIPDTAFTYEGATLGSIMADLVDALLPLPEVANATATQIAGLDFNVNKLVQSNMLAELSGQLGELPKAANDAGQAAFNVGEVLDDLKTEVLELGGTEVQNSLKTFTNFIENAEGAQLFDSTGKAVEGLRKQLDDLEISAENLTVAYGDEARGLIAAGKKVATTYTSADGVFTAIFENQKEGFKSTADATKEQTERQVKFLEDFKLKVLDIQGELALAQTEGFFNLQVAEIEADAQKVAAAFESLGVTIQSTGDLLGDLFGALVSSNLGTRDIIKEEIEKESARRDAALAAQIELTEAQIANLNSRTEALARGDALIKVETNNLSAPLELIWLEILKEIQIKANAEGVEFLLDLPAAA